MSKFTVTRPHPDVLRIEQEVPAGVRVDQCQIEVEAGPAFRRTIFSNSSKITVAGVPPALVDDGISVTRQVRSDDAPTEYNRTSPTVKAPTPKQEKKEKKK